MSRKRAPKPDSKHYVRCGHPWCTDCRTKRSRNRGNRRVRHGVKALLRKMF